MSTAAIERTPCVRCGKTHHTPQAFMLQCSRCHRFWHHGCHIPPLSEDDVLALVEASGNRAFGEGLKTWQCRRCAKRTREAADASNQTGSGSASSSQNPAPQIALPSSASSRTPATFSLDAQPRNVEASLSSTVQGISVDRPLESLRVAPATSVASPTNNEALRVHQQAKAPASIATIQQPIARKAAKVATKRAAPTPAAQLAGDNARHPNRPLSSNATSNVPIPSENVQRNLSESTDITLPSIAEPASPSTPVRSSSSATPDFRALIASMRASGKLHAPPSVLGVPSSSTASSRASSTIPTDVPPSPLSRSSTAGLSYIEPATSRSSAGPSYETPPISRASTAGLSYASPPASRASTAGLSYATPPASRASTAGLTYIDPERATPQAAHHPSPSRPMLLFDYMESLHASAPPGQRDTLDRLLTARAQRLSIKQADDAETGRAGRRKPLAKHLGKRARQRKEDQGMNFVKEEWIAQGKVDVGTERSV